MEKHIKFHSDRIFGNRETKKVSKGEPWLRKDGDVIPFAKRVMIGYTFHQPIKNARYITTGPDLPGPVN